MEALSGRHRGTRLSRKERLSDELRRPTAVLGGIERRFPDHLRAGTFSHLRFRLARVRRTECLRGGSSKSDDTAGGRWRRWLGRVRGAGRGGDRRL